MAQMANNDFLSIPVEQLLLNTNNPRFEHRESNQRDALQRVISNQGSKLVKLASDIAKRGLNPSKSLIVRKARNGQFVVLDGNRRITAIKLMLVPALLQSTAMSQSMAAKFRSNHEQASRIFVDGIRCVVLTDEQAKHWLNLEHIATRNGVATEPWDTAARHRFQGTTPQLKVIDLVRDGPYLDKSVRDDLDKVPISHIERIINTPDAAKMLGVKVERGELHITDDQQLALAKLSLLVADILTTKIPARELFLKDQRIDYVSRLLARPLPTASTPAATSTKPKPKPAKKAIPTERKALIPNDCILRIPHPRLNRVYDELTKLNVDDYKNSVAVLLRVFLELSVDAYGKTHGIPFKKLSQRKCSNCNKVLSSAPMDMSFREKTLAVCEHMEAHGILDKTELHGTKALVPKTIIDLHAYVHSKDFNPKPSELRATFDDIRVFVEKLWP